MKILLCIFAILLVGMQALSIDASLAPGLSVKNLGLYLIGMLLVLRLVGGGEIKGGVRAIPVAFVLLCAYATVSWLVVVLAVRYPSYDSLKAFMSLKSSFYDPAIFFFVFFYAAQSTRDALSVLTALLLSAVAAHLVTVVDSFGLLDLIPERTELNDAGRSQGAFGEANIHGAMVVLLLPAVLAKMVASRGFSKLAWALSALVCVASLLLVSSRGALLGLVLGSVWGAYLLRRGITAGAVARWVGFATAAASIGIMMLGATYTDLLRERVVGLTFGGDAFEASSGRSEIWAVAVARMFESPWTLLTGFGHEAYSAMQFGWAPHNTYLGIWFNLGFPGLLLFLTIIAIAVLSAKVGAERAAPGEVRTQLVAYVIGFLSLAVAAFFVELHGAWQFVWAYAGLAMRLCAELSTQPSAEPRPARHRKRTWVGGPVKTRRAAGRA